MNKIKQILESFFEIKILKFKKFKKLENSEVNYLKNLALIKKYKMLIKKIIFQSENISTKNVENVMSQNLQDLIVLDLFGFKKNGYFIEAGACDGKLNSNTYFLEKNFSWTGLLIEPLSLYFDSLVQNRKSLCKNYALTPSDLKQSEFLEVKSNDLSTLKGYEDNDYHSENRQKNKIIMVDSISLFSLMNNVSSPRVVDFLSLDTEGSEYDILKNFNFNEYKFNVICIEHNFNNNRILISKLLIKNGYKKIDFSFSDIDDYFIHQDFVPKNQYFSY